MLASASTRETSLFSGCGAVHVGANKQSRYVTKATLKPSTRKAAGSKLCFKPQKNCYSSICALSSKTAIHMSDGLSALKMQQVRGIKRNTSYSKEVLMSIFGVGAPEALVIGVVALIVFGPKGLAEAAKSLGQTVKAFQPTIRELQEVSADFKNTLEEEIGLEDIKKDLRTVTNPPPRAATPTPGSEKSLEEVAKDFDPIPIEKNIPEELTVTDEMKAASAAAAWGNVPPPSTVADAPASPAAETPVKAASEKPAPKETEAPKAEAPKAEAPKGTTAPKEAPKKDKA